MSERCAVCKKGKGPTKCEICGFSDDGFINRSFPIPEDTKNWLETVVKPYRATWEARKQNNDLQVQLEEAQQRELALKAQIDALKRTASSSAQTLPIQPQASSQIRHNPSSEPEKERKLSTENKLVIGFFIALFAIFVIIMVKPDSAKTHFEKGNEHYNRNDYTKAIESYSEAIKLNPNEFMYLHSRGLAFYNNKNYVKAIGDFQVVLQINPNYEPAKQYLANIKQIQDKLKQDEQKAKVNQQSSSFVQEREDKLQRAKGVVKLEAKQPSKEATTVQSKSTVTKSSSSAVKSIKEQGLVKKAMTQPSTALRISVAVLPSDGIGASLSNSEENVVSDKVREVAMKILPSDKFIMLTQKAVITRLGGVENYIKESKEGFCIVDLGRKAMVDYIAQAIITKVGNKMRLTVELYNVSTGALVGLFNGEADNIHGLINLIDKNVPNAVFRKIPGVSNAVSEKAR